ncbi:MAG: hypothetical protein ABSF28_07760 [Terracidiphilus sp.]|jgi:hypothetical protein
MASLVYVLHDVQIGKVFAVVTDLEVAQTWLGYDPAFAYSECEVDDFTNVNGIADEIEAAEEEKCQKI